MSQQQNVQYHVISLGLFRWYWMLIKWVWLPWIAVVVIFAYPWVLAIIGALAAIVLYFGLKAARDVDRSRREHRERLAAER